jgi:hypothetical protein
MEVDDEKKIKRRIYMRQYKAREYANKHEEMKNKQREYYHINKEKKLKSKSIDNTQFKKLTTSLDKLLILSPELLNTFMLDYMNDHTFETQIIN